VQLTFWNGPCAGRLRFHERILLRQMTMPRISYCIEINCASAIKGVIPALIVTGLSITSLPSPCAEAGAGGIKRAGACVLNPTQRERVEQIIAGETPQLPMTRGNPNLSGTKQKIQIPAVSKDFEN